MKIYSEGSSSGVLSLVEDIWAEILCLITVSDVMAVRLVCRRMNTITRSRVLWTKICLAQVIDVGLPWPAPLADLPTETIELLTIRAFIMAEYWDKGELIGENIPIGCIQRPIGSVTWMHIARSRWLITGLKDGCIEIWDLEHPSRMPSGCCRKLNGFVTRGVVLDCAETGIEVVTTTSSAQTYVISIDAPYVGTGPGSTPLTIGIEEVVNGYGSVVDCYDGLLAFTRRVDNLPYIVDRKTLSSVRLLRGPEVQKAQSAVDIYMQSDAVIVAKDWHVEIYNTSVIRSALSDNAESDNTPSVAPLKSIPFSEMAWQASINRPLGHQSRAMETISLSTYCRERVCVDSVRLTPAPHISAEIADEPESIDLDGRPIRLTWGLSGTRTVYVGYESLASPLWLWGFRIKKPPVPHRLVEMKFSGDTDSDFTWVQAFDEVSGLVAVALTSGEIWVFDPSSLWRGRFDELPMREIKYLAGNLECTNEDPSAPITDDIQAGYVLVSKLIYPADPCSQPPNYPPWTPVANEAISSASDQALAYHSQSWSTLPKEAIPPRFTDNWMLSINPIPWAAFEYYGGLKWFFNECLHVPGEPKPHLMSLDTHHGSGSSVEVTDAVLIECDGHFFALDGDVFRYGGSEVLMFQGDPTLEDILARIGANEEPLLSAAWRIDATAEFSRVAWQYAAFSCRKEICGEVIY